MLSTSTSASSQQQHSTALNIASSPSNSVKNIKSEPFSAISPRNENASNHSMLDECSNNNNNPKSNSNNMTMEVGMRERDGITGTTTTASTSTSSSASMMRQNSNSSVNSCPATGNNASPPNNASDHSNSSNLSSTVDANTGEMLQDLNAEKTNKKKGLNNSNIKDDENGKEKPNSNLSKNALNLNLLTSIKDDPDVLDCLANVKKEEHTLSPNMSPVGFGSIGNVEGSVRPLTPVKLNDLTSSVVAGIKTDTLIAGSGDDHSIGNIGGINNNSLNDSVVGSVGGGVGNALQNTLSNFNNNSGSNNSGSSLGNCMDYMQQQNHIFVFSTQLANKGAESVLSGQFPTIIAYHCTQPATKNFLEEFFIKNPMKMTKLQRQNSLNICSISVGGGGGQQWMGGGCNQPKNQSKISQKPNVNKMNFVNPALQTNTDNKPHSSTLHSSATSGFPEPADVLSSDNELMCWEQTRNCLDSSGGSGSDTSVIKMLDGVDPGQQQNHNAGKLIIDNDGNIPSLQGVKVPDENLTPQQRQHREEQLAKIKKMNQFLFPENGSDFRMDPNTQLPQTQLGGKLGVDGIPANIGSIMMSLPGSSGHVGNSNNPAIRNMPPNLNQNKPSALTNNDNIPALGDEGILAADIINHDMGGGGICGANNKGTSNNNMAINAIQSNLPCGPGGGGGNGGATNTPNINIGNIPANGMSCHGGIVNGPIGAVSHSPEAMSGLSQNCSSGGNASSDGNLCPPSKVLLAEMHSQDVNHVGMAQIEWSKLQHQFFEERIKGNKMPTDMPPCTPPMCRSNSTGLGVNIRPNLTGSNNATATPPNGNQNLRNSQGPPPPYHPTQRSASVPIATQSPNPASPNNPTSNLSLPSPRTSGAMGIPVNSPVMDVHASIVTTLTSDTTTTTAMSTTNTLASNTFMQEGSPTGASCVGSNNGSRNRNNMNQFNSNPSTPLSHLSPKDLETFNTTGDLKNARPSPQRSRTPLIAGNNNNSTTNNISDGANIEGRFPAASPGSNFPPQVQGATSGGIVNTYKPQQGGPMDVNRQTPGPQFCRRTDNLPLNPNSNRPPQNKLNHNFDPISSLAQMSQQLTSCVSLNTSGCVVNNPSGIMGPNDMNMATNVNQNIDGIMPTMEGVGGNMDHCNPNPGGNMNLPHHLAGVGPFVSNNCHMNPMLGPMGQRLLNQKMCGGSFNPGNGSGMREGPGNFHGMMPSQRMMNRMAVNFGNFNVSPNIQVKASTPNTIQYMPVRPQNSNVNNMRMPPSLEFLHRYANPGSQNIGMENGHMGQVNSASIAEANKMTNNPSSNPNSANTSLNFFQNCNQMGPLGGEQDDMPGNMLPAHDMNMGSMMRGGMRAMRQHNMSGHSTPNQVILGPRMQTPGGNMMGPGGPQFPSNAQDPMECNDAMFGGPGGANQMFMGGQQKSGKGGGGGLCQNINSANVGGGGNNSQMGNAVLMQNEHAAMQSPVNGPVLLGPNSNMMQSTMNVNNSNASPVGCGGGVVVGGNGNVNYKSFVGPASNDLKYAQQYHSFQQQLYATSTRSQQGGGSGNNASIPAFFVNK